MEMYSTTIEGKSVIAKRFISTLKNIIYNYMNSISKNVYTNKLYGMVNRYNDTYHSTIKMKLFAVKSNTCIDSSNLITKIFTLKTKQIFAKGCTPN